jgi:hypothetical protein
MHTPAYQGRTTILGLSAKSGKKGADKKFSFVSKLSNQIATSVLSKPSLFTIFSGENSYCGCFGKLIETLGLGVCVGTPIWMGKIDAPKPWIVIRKFDTHFAHSVASRSDT